MGASWLKTMVAVLAIIGATRASSAAELPTKAVLTLEAAKRVGAAAEAEANKRGATVVIVVVDDGGSVLWLERLNDTQVASVDVGIGKARTAAIFADRARSSRIRFETAAWRHWRCPARPRCKVAFR